MNEGGWTRLDEKCLVAPARCESVGSERPCRTKQVLGRLKCGRDQAQSRLDELSLG